MTTRTTGAALTCVVLLGTTACGGGDTEGGAERPKVGVVLKTANEYFSAMEDGITEMDKSQIDFLGVEAPGGEGTENVQAQVAAVEGMLTRGADAIAIAPIGPQLQPVLDRAVQDGVEIVLIDNDIPGWNGATSYVGTDNLAGGRLAGEFIAEQLGGQGTVAVMAGIPGVPALDDRVNGMLSALEGTQIEVVTTLPTDCGQTDGVDVMQTFATTNPDVDAIYSSCGPPVLGAIEARAKSDPFKDSMLLVGFDCLPDEAEAILAGDQTASVAQFPKEMGTTAVETAAAAARGGSVEARIDTGTEIVTQENAQMFTTFQ